MSDIRIPKPLKRGDTVAMVGISGPIHGDIEDGVRKAEETLRGLGFEVIVDPNCYKRIDFGSGTGEERARALEQAFTDDRVDGIWCMKGGYSTIRMIDLVDWDLIARHPKTFIGYSDITMVHAVLNDRCRMATIHGKMPASGIDPAALPPLMRAVTGEPDRKVVNLDGAPLACERGGVAEGELSGGNLSLLSSLCGTRYEPDYTGKIIFIEEVNELTYHIDEMLRQMYLAGNFDHCAGVLFGSFTDCSMEYRHDLNADEIVTQLSQLLHVPVLSHLHAGHNKDSMPLMLGRRYRMDADARTLTLTD